MPLPQCSSMVVSYSDTVRHLLFAAGVTGGFAAMAQKVLVEMVDDIDGGVANQTVPFGLDGVSYEIDLSDANAAALRDVLARYIAAGRRIGGRKVRLAAGESAQAKKSGGTASDRERTRQIREWASANGYTVSERG